MTRPPLWVLIPAKDSRIAKRRLSAVLSEDERVQLAYQLLRRTLHLVAEVSGISGIVVITRDPTLAQIAREITPHIVADPSPDDLNAALRVGQDYALMQGAEALLVLPTDLAWLTPEILQTFIASLPPHPSVALAPDSQERGTNALYLCPPNAIPFTFGVDSALYHRRAAEERGLPTITFHHPAFAQDLDHPDDWILLSLSNHLLTTLGYRVQGGT